MLKLIYCLIAIGISVPMAWGGTCTPTVSCEGELVIEYTGIVLPGDVDKVVRSIEESNITTILINSPGGIAQTGIALNRLARRLGLRTLAGEDFGAWSAAGLFWLGGSREFQGEGQAGLHFAFNGFGITTGPTDYINSVMAVCMDRSISDEDTVIAILALMDLARNRHGVSGFVVLAEDEVTIEDLSAADNATSEKVMLILNQLLNSSHLPSVGEAESNGQLSRIYSKIKILSLD